MTAAGAVDVFAGGAVPAAPEPVNQAAQGAGTWYCPTTGGKGESAVLTIAATGDQPSTVTVSRYGGNSEKPAGDEPLTIDPGAA
ncbi:MAG: hypothetical protein ACRDU8_07570, partial [Egibacteraceae bacterium]